MKWKGRRKQFLILTLFIIGITLPLYFLNFSIENTTSCSIKNEMAIHKFYDAKFSVSEGLEEFTEQKTFLNNPNFDATSEYYSLVTEYRNEVNEIENLMNNITQINVSIFAFGIKNEYLEFLYQKLDINQDLEVFNLNSGEICVSENFANNLSLQVNDVIGLNISVNLTYDVLQNFTIASIIPFNFENTTRIFESQFLKDYMNYNGNIIFFQYTDLNYLIPESEKYYYINYRKNSYSSTSIRHYIQFLDTLYSFSPHPPAKYLNTENILPIISNKVNTYWFLLVSYFIILFFITIKFFDSILGRNKVELFLYNTKGFTRKFLKKKYFNEFFPPLVVGILISVSITIFIGLFLYPTVSNALFLDADFTYLIDSIIFSGVILSIIIIIILWRLSRMIKITNTINSVKDDINSGRDLHWSTIDSVLLILGLSGVFLLFISLLSQLSNQMTYIMQLLQNLFVPLVPFFPVCLSYALLKIILIIKEGYFKKKKRFGIIKENIVSSLSLQNHRFYKKNFLVFTLFSCLLFSTSYFYSNITVSINNSTEMEARHILGTDYLIFTEDIPDLLDNISKYNNLTTAPMFSAIKTVINGDQGIINAIHENFTRTCYDPNTFFLSLHNNKSISNFTINDYEILISETTAKNYNVSIGAHLNISVISSESEYYNPVLINNGTYTIIGLYDDHYFYDLIPVSGIIGSFTHFNDIRINQDNNSKWLGEIFVNLGDQEDKKSNRDALTAGLRQYFTNEDEKIYQIRVEDIFSVISLLQSQNPAQFYQHGILFSILINLFIIIGYDLLFFDNRKKEFEFYKSRGIKLAIAKSVLKKEKEEPMIIGIISGILMGACISFIFLIISFIDLGIDIPLSGFGSLQPYLLMLMLGMVYYIVQRVDIFWIFNQIKKIKSINREIV